VEITIVGTGNMGRAIAPRALAHRLQASGFDHMARQGSVGTGFASTVKTLP
jgi:3-hydroxyisobutyrate dehydrogenase-like beta-hydroxyacid dehydrogenase